MRRVRLFGDIGESSGYGKAVKNFAEAFSQSKVPTKLNFPRSKMNHVSHLSNYQGGTDTDFYLHCPPYAKHRSNNYKIAYFYWEADKLPKNWIKPIRDVHEIWAPCELVRKACLSSGYTGKIKIVPTPMKRFSLKQKIAIPSYFSNEYILSDEIYKFYSIFQWHERKGYKELLKAYLSEFTSDDNVVLILKVNPLKIKDYDEARISRDILKVKGYLGKKNYPLIFLSKQIVPTRDIHALHALADCYVSPHHGEGWGMPIHDAMFAGNQIITTKFGGVTEYLNDNSAHLIKHELKPVTGMQWSPLYGSYQKWAYPSVKHLAGIMRDVYVNHDKYEIKSKNASKLAKTMDIESVAKIINRELGR